VPSVVVLGTSVRGRAISAVHWDAPGARARLVVIGCIHGDEPAGIAITRAVAGLVPPSGLEVWAVDDLNPDGVAAHTRVNARGVDLNRNFPYGWRSYGRRGDPEYPGAAPLSEPESRIAFDLVNRVRPTITIWYHQHQDLVDESGGNVAIEARYAALVGLPLRRLTRYPGSAAGWQNAALAPTTAFVVELPAGVLPQADVTRYANAVLALS
jgi:protein MpaA